MFSYYLQYQKFPPAAILVRIARRKCACVAGVPRLACPILIALFRAGFPRQRVYWKNFIFFSSQIEWDMFMMTVFLSIWNQMEFHLVQNRKENCHHDHIPFNVKGNGNIVFSVWGQWKLGKGITCVYCIQYKYTSKSSQINQWIRSFNSIQLFDLHNNCLIIHVIIEVEIERVI